MIATENKTIKDIIIEFLLMEAATAKQIQAFVVETGSSVSIQGVYKQLKILLADNVLVKRKGLYAVSNEWRERLQKLLVIHKDPILEEGEKVTYVFNSLNHTDAFWKHLERPYHYHRVDEPRFFYSPHEIWLYVPGREESEDLYCRQFAVEQKHGFLALGSDTPLDLQFRKKYRDDYFHVEVNGISSISDTDHLAVIGDMITTVRLPKKAAEAVNAVYGNRELTEEEAREKLVQIFNQVSKVIFKIERNKKKAQTLKKKISKNFLIPKSVQSLV